MTPEQRAAFKERLKQSGGAAPSPNRGYNNPFAGGPDIMATPEGGRSGLLKTLTTPDADVGFMGRQGIGLLEGATFGALGPLMARAEGARQRSAGEDVAPYQERLGLIRENLDENSGLLGQIAGMAPRYSPAGLALTGVVKGGRKMFPALARYGRQTNRMGFATRLAESAAVGGVLAGSYAQMQGKEPKQVVTEALFGAGAGAAFSPLADGLVALGRNFGKNRGPAAAQEIIKLFDQISEDLPSGVIDRSVLDTGQLNPQALAQRINDPNDSLAMNFPDALLNTVKTRLADADKVGGGDYYTAMQPLIRYLTKQHQNSSPEFADRVAAAIGGQNVRTRAEFRADTAAEVQQLQPQYNQVLDNASNLINDGSGNMVPLTVGDYRNVVDALFVDNNGIGPKTKTAQAVADVIRDEVPGLRKTKTDKRGRATTFYDENTPLDIRDVQAAIQKLDTIMFGGKVGDTSVEKGIKQRYLVNLRSGLKDLLYEMEGTGQLAQLDSQYSDMAAIDRFFEIGQNIADRSQSTAAMIEGAELIGTGVTPAQQAALVEGLKRGIVDMVGENPTPSGIRKAFKDNTDRWDNLRMILGNDAVDEIIANAERYVITDALARRVPTSPPAKELDADRTIGSALGAAADTGIIGAGLLGQFSSGLIGGALRRRATGLGQPAVSGNAPREAGDLATLLSMRSPDAAQRINALALSGAPRTPENALRITPGLLQGLPLDMGEE